MQDVALTVPAIVAHAAAVHGDREVLTARGPQQISGVSYHELGQRAARLANALREIGICGDERVATLQWSNQEHLDCYAAVPSMGAVLHTLNLRLPPEQLTWIANHADDRVVIVDGTVLPLLAAALPSMTSVRTVLVTGTGDLSAVEGCGKDVLRYDDVVAEVRDFLVGRAERAADLGVSEVWIDPGIGFGKTTAHNLEIMGRLDELVDTGWPVVLGVSRKRFLGDLTARSDLGTAAAPVEGHLDPTPPDDRREASVALATWAFHLGVSVVRAHDVRSTFQAARGVGSPGSRAR